MKNRMLGGTFIESRHIYMQSCLKLVVTLRVSQHGDASNSSIHIDTL